MGFSLLDALLGRTYGHGLGPRPNIYERVRNRVYYIVFKSERIYGGRKSFPNSRFSHTSKKVLTFYHVSV